MDKELSELIAKQIEFKNKLGDLEAEMSRMLKFSIRLKEIYEEKYGNA